MKIVIYTQNVDIINIFNHYTRNESKSPLLIRENAEVSIVRNEKSLFDLISDETIEGFALSVPSNFAKKSIDFIKRKSPYTPVLLYGNMKDLISINGADIHIPLSEVVDESYYRSLLDLIVSNIVSYSKNFEKLKKLMTKMAESIDFDNCKYDPTRRMFFHKGQEIKKLSAKEGGILELLSSNFGQVVKREIILEKVWKKDDYFSGRSMDVYVTHLRRLFQKNDIKLSIKNISGVGLILE